MLKKLLKYDLKSMFKFLIVFYSLSIFFAILTRIFLNINNSFMMNIIGQICSGTTIVMVANILINNTIRLWVRFKNNFYGDESYLTHTLPVEKRTLYLSKIITSIITLLVSIFVIVLTLFIAYYSKENINTLKDFLLPITNVYDSNFIKLLICTLFIFFIEILSAIQAGYTGIILGHKMNNNKTVFSVIYGYLSYILTQVLCLLLLFIISLFNKDIANLFMTNSVISIDILKILFYVASLIYLILLIVIYFINVKMFKKGVNVD